MAYSDRLIHRFWTYVDRTSGENGCWLWEGGSMPNRNGKILYGLFHDDDNKNVRAHRFSFEISHGAIPDGAVIRHSCDNGLCVNPKHLQVGTQQDNVDDRQARGRWKPRIGEDNNKAVFTNNDIHCIRDALKKGYSQRELATFFSVWQPTISCVSRRKTWAHLPEVAL